MESVALGRLVASKCQETAAVSGQSFVLLSFSLRQ